MDRDRISQIEELIEHTTNLAAEIRHPDYQRRVEIGLIDHYQYGALFADAASALRQLLQERQWRTIDSAPKDGTPIDLWVIVDGWQDEKRIPNCTWGWMRKWGGEEVQGWVGLGNLHEDRVPTHWMPLPSPPPEHTP